MTDIDLDHMKRWVGRQITRQDVITPRLAAGLAAVLDQPTDLGVGEMAPVGIHWCLSPDVVPMRALGADGHPERGDFLPPVPLPRRMWAGGDLQFSGDFRVGDTVTRTSQVTDVAIKTGRSGVLCFVTVSHSYTTGRGLALRERHNIVYRGAKTSKVAAPFPQMPAPDLSLVQQATAVLLMRYSAITFNGHRIHYDRSYCQTAEGYPGLVVHGPLQATYLLQLAAQMNGGTVPPRFAYHAQRPLFDGAAFRVNGTKNLLWVENDQGAVTMQASV